MITGRVLWPRCVTFRPILTLVRALHRGSIVMPAVWHTVTRHARWPDSLVTPGLLPSMESHLRFW